MRPFWSNLTTQAAVFILPAALGRQPMMSATHRTGPSNGRAMVLQIPDSLPPWTIGGVMAQRTVS
jgi:hypothetical protein